MNPIFTILQWIMKDSVCQFEVALDDPQKAQENLLSDLVKSIQKTEYGRFYKIGSTQDFHSNLPIVDYEDIEPWIEKQKGSTKPILWPKPPIIYEQTSGSSGPAKFIPYTKALQKSFTRMGVLWSSDVLQFGPKLQSGKLFFSISPSFHQSKNTKNGTPIGFTNDTEYISGWQYWALKPFLAVSPKISGIQDPDQFLFELSKALVTVSNLEIISVWNPGFLLMLLEYIQTNHRKLGLRAEPDFQTIWPNLKIISCWNSAQAKPLTNQIAQLFPNVLIQGKGLLATEAPMTIPWFQANGFVPMLDEVYFEFETEAGSILPVHQLEVGCNYSIIVTQKSGLCRYRIGDIVEVTHKYKETPCLDFIGRGASVADFQGEKLHEAFVRTCLKQLQPTNTDFQMLAFCRNPKSRYILFLQNYSGSTKELSLKLEELLQQAYHYRHARLLKQLGPCEVVVNPKIATAFLQHEQRNGKKLGDIKHPVLYTTAIDTLSGFLIG